MTKVTCSIDGCENLSCTRGWCNMHYLRWRVHGDPLWQSPTTVDRFWAKVDKFGPDGFHSQTGENLGPCWLWTTPRVADGYGEFQVNRQKVLAHRFSYTLLIGPIPEGLELDHLCRVRHCVRPSHLEPVTHRVNLLRGDTMPIRNAAKTHCPAGHEYSMENTYIRTDGRRYCRTCHQERRKSRRPRIINPKGVTDDSYPDRDQT